VSSPVFTSEELRVVAMNSSSRRGKSVARRRLILRWVSWALWSILLPVIGLLTVIAVLAGLAFWQYMGRDAAYVAAQKWVQQEFGKFQTSNNNIFAKANGNGNGNGNNNHPSTNRSDNASLIPLTYEATPDLQIDRNLTIKTKP
jgi:hypothetical protein